MKTHTLIAFYGALILSAIFAVHDITPELRENMAIAWMVIATANFLMYIFAKDPK